MAITNAEWLYDNLIKSAALSLSGANEVSGFEVDNLTNRNVRLGLLTDAITTQYIIIDMGTVAVPIKGVFLENINLVTGDTLRLQGSDDNFVTTPDDVAVTIRTHSGLYKAWDSVNEHFVMSQRNYAYLLASWSRKKYRVAMSKLAGSSISIGEIYLAGSHYVNVSNYLARPREGQITSKLARQNISGHEIEDINYQKWDQASRYLGVAQSQKNILSIDINANEFVCYLFEGSGNEGFYGTIQVGAPERMSNANIWQLNNVRFKENA
jgi:hypothetical protein